MRSGGGGGSGGALIGIEEGGGGQGGNVRSGAPAVALAGPSVRTFAGGLSGFVVVVGVLSEGPVSDGPLTCRV